MDQPDDIRPVYTIGHSNRSIDEFVSLLQQNGIEQLIDVLAAHGYSLWHILGPDQRSRHQLSTTARLTEDGAVIWPSAGRQQNLW